MVRVILLLHILFMLLSCSTIEFNSDGKELFYVGTLSKSERIVELTRTKDFYFWGLTPEKNDFNLEDETNGLGVDRPSFVGIEQDFSFSNIAFTLITLGLYCPVDYKITLLSHEEKK